MENSKSVCDLRAAQDSMPMNCRVCGLSDLHVLGRVKNRSVDALYCRSCDTVFPSRFPAKSELDEYYSGFTARHQYGSPLRERVATHFSRKKTKSILDKVRRYTTIERVLDFGGGSGYFSRGFQLNDVSVDLYDIDYESMEVAKSRGIKTINSIDPEAQYDLVFSSHVIEHCPDLHQFIEQATCALKPGGVFAVCCPHKNANEFYRFLHCRKYRNRIESLSTAEQPTKRWFCFDPPRHLYAISKGTMNSLAISHELTLLALFTEYFRCSDFHSGDLPFPFLIKPLLKDWRGLSELMLSVLFSRIMKGIHGQHGDSLVALFQKPSTLSYHAH